ncbi:MAG: DUF309 domain-containing protein [Desulfobulbaceae bacterium]|nr:MAG: DUF309 domain-containing protein [Desulfobulbaceae bacterium]
MNERKIRIPHIDQAETAPPPVFEPFQDRRSRDIRNALSSALAEAIAEGRPEPFEREATRLLDDRPPERYRDYITDRLPRYHRALEAIARGITDPYAQGVELWNERLFFEMHEVLEHAWYYAEGDHKLLLQAMIRAAGVYVKLEYGYVRQAAKMAVKAREVLERSREVLLHYFEPEELLTALARLDPVPPRLLPPSRRQD